MGAVSYAKWNFAKAVYRFDGDFLKILMDSEDVKISRDVFDNLAVPCFFVCDNSSDDMGFFVYVETTDEVVKFSVVSLIRLDEKRVGACNDSIWIPNGMMLSEGLKLWQDTVNPNTISPVLLDMARKDMTRAIQTAYYLSSLNVVMREERIPKQKRPRTSNGKPLNIHLWNVGYRLSCNYPAYEDGSYVLVDGNGSTEIADKKAIRRAHYEVIPVSQDAIKVKWVEPKEL